MRNNLKPIERKQIEQLETTEDIKNFVKDKIKTNHDPDVLLDQIGILLKKHYLGKKSKKKQIDELFHDFSNIFGLDTGYTVAFCHKKEYRPMAIQFARDIIKEYQCTTSIEKAMANNIALSYTKIIQYSRILSQCSSSESVNKLSIQYCYLISKEIDRANRQFNSSLSLLQQIKSPSIDIKIQSKNAFVSEKQEFINNN